MLKRKRKGDYTQMGWEFVVSGVGSGKFRVVGVVAEETRGKEKRERAKVQRERKPEKGLFGTGFQGGGRSPLQQEKKASTWSRKNGH
jgi:hypothetical protein